MNLAELFSQLAVRAKLTPDQVKELTSNAELAKINVPDEVNNSLLSNLLSPELAAQNYDVKKAIRASLTAEMLDPIDSEMQGFTDIIGDEEWAASWKKNASTYDKIKQLKGKLAEAVEAKVTAAKGSNASKEATKQIEELTNQIKQIQADSQKQITQLTEQFAAREQEFVSDSYFSRFQYANEKIPVSANAKTAQYVLADEAAKIKAKIVYNKDSKSLELRNADDVSLPYIVNGAPVSFDHFAEKTIAEAGLLKVSTQAPPANQPPAYVPPAQQQPSGRTRDVSQYNDMLAAFGQDGQ